MLLDVAGRHRSRHGNHQRLLAQFRGNLLKHFADNLRLHAEQHAVRAVHRLAILRSRRTPSSLASDAAFSACFTVAVTRPASNNPCFRYARSKIPPSFPVPKTANLLPASFCAIDQALLTTHARASTPIKPRLLSPGASSGPRFE